MGAAAIPLVMTALSAAGTAYNTRRTEKKQDNQLARQLQRQGNDQQEADARTAQLIQQRAGSTDKEERGEALGSFMKNMIAQQGNANRGLQTTGGVSDAYTQSAADASLGIGQYGDKIADLLSRIDAPGRQRQNEANEGVRFQQDINQLKRRSAGADFLSDLRLRGIKRNPWIDLGAGVLSSAAGGMAGRGGGAATGAGANVNIGNNMDNFMTAGWGR